MSDPPLVVPIEEVLSSTDSQQIHELLRDVLDHYLESLPAERRWLVERFDLVQVARKVVGVGSVGTRAWILLLEAHDGLDPLLLQAKEAGPSVLARYLEASDYDNQGQRVVVGQRRLQAVGDILLGWHRVQVPGGPGQDYYMRQLRDWKFSPDLAAMDTSPLTTYGQLCGWTLARAHARTGDRIAIASYLGSSDRFDRALAAFAEEYADLTERDHADLAAAVASGRAEADDDL